MNDAVNDYNMRRGREHGRLVLPLETRGNSDRLWAIVQDYIDFEAPDGIRPAAAPGAQEGEGMPDDTPLVDEPLPPPIEPVAPYNDIRNDPYFVVR